MRVVSLWVAVLLAAVAFVAGCGGGGDSPGDGKNVVLWYGWSGAEANGLRSLVNEYNRTHHGTHVTAQFIGSNKFALQKVLTGVRGGKYPDIVYLWGSLAPQVARLPVAVTLNDRVAKDPGIHWNDFWPGERQVASVNGKIIGVPALVDDLCVVYNKDLLAKAGLQPPAKSWTWDDFQRYAKAMTDPSSGQFGVAFAADGTENTVWRYEAMLWEAGGQILTSDNSKPAFDSPAGVKALEVLRKMAADKSMYVDTSGTKSEQLFNSGKIGMMVTGPWDLPQFPDVHYGVQIMPAFAGVGDHQSISGPDNWVVLDHGPQRVDTAYAFLRWLSQPAQVEKFSLATGDLPTRRSLAGDQQFMQRFENKLKGVSTFVENLGNVKQSRPATADYSKVSEQLGQAIVAVLLGKKQSRDALSEAATQVSSQLGQG